MELLRIFNRVDMIDRLICFADLERRGCKILRKIILWWKFIKANVWAVKVLTKWTLQNMVKENMDLIKSFFKGHIFLSFILCNSSKIKNVWYGITDKRIVETCVCLWNTSDNIPSWTIKTLQYCLHVCLRLLIDSLKFI